MSKDEKLRALKEEAFQAYIVAVIACQGRGSVQDVLDALQSAYWIGLDLQEDWPEEGQPLEPPF